RVSCIERGGSATDGNPRTLLIRYSCCARTTTAASRRPRDTICDPEQSAPSLSHRPEVPQGSAVRPRGGVARVPAPAATLLIDSAARHRLGGAARADAELAGEREHPRRRRLDSRRP